MILISKIFLRNNIIKIQNTKKILNIYQIKYNFILEKDINQIKQSYYCKESIKNKEDESQSSSKLSLFQKTKMYSQISKLMLKEAYSSIKQDYKMYKEIKLKNELDWNLNEKIAIMKIYDNMRKMIGPACIAPLPMAPPLLLLYIYTLPDFTPTWVVIDTVYQKMLSQRKIKQLQAYNYFLLHQSQKHYILDPNLTVQQLNIQSFTLNEFQRLSELILGYSYNGCTIINRILKKLFNMKNFKFNYFLSQNMSRYIVLNKLANAIDRDLINKKILKDMTVQEQILWKIKKAVQQIQKNSNDKNQLEEGVVQKNQKNM